MERRAGQEIPDFIVSDRIKLTKGLIIEKIPAWKPAAFNKRN